MCTPLFLLGAGFNYDAKKLAGTIIGKSIYSGKCDIDCGYPLLSDLYKTCFPDKEIDPSISIEELFNNSIKNNNFEPIRLLCDEIMKADLCLIPKLRNNKPNCYANFFKKFRESNFLTFNYDSLTELFLLELGQWYPHDGYGINVEVGHNWYIEIDKIKKKNYLEKTSKSLVLHLHGSLCIYIKEFEIENNLLKLKDNPLFKFDPDKIAGFFHPYERAQFDVVSSINIEDRIIAPVPDKTEGLKNDFIIQMYSKAKKLLIDSKLLVVIGYNFSEHDKSSYHNLIDNWEGEILIISPNANKLKNRLMKEYPKINWRSLSTTFKNWVDSKFERLN